MQSARSKCIAAAIAASTLFFAGCNAGGISPSLAPNAAPAAGVTAQAAPDATTAYAYTCQNVGTVDCLVYKNGKLYKTVKNAALKDPIGVVADKNGLLYVAN